MILIEPTATEERILIIESCPSQGVILLVKADERNEAKRLADLFLVAQEVLDWYMIGGRCSGVLTGYKPWKDPRNIVKCFFCDGAGILNNTVAPKECHLCKGKGNAVAVWQEMWVEVDDNVMPCSDPRVANTIVDWAKAWQANTEKAIIEEDKFSFRSKLYDTARKSNTLPDDFTGYWAVVVEMRSYPPMYDEA